MDIKRPRIPMLEYWADGRLLNVFEKKDAITELRQLINYVDTVEKKTFASNIHKCKFCNNELCDAQEFNNTCFKCGKSPY